MLHNPSESLLFLRQFDKEDVVADEWGVKEPIVDDWVDDKMRDADGICDGRQEK